MRNYVAFTIILFALQTQAQTKMNRFATGLDSIRRQLKIPAMSVALEKDHRIVLKTAFGYSDLDNHIKATPATVFRVASVTKTFTSTLVMQLVENKQLDLDSPISRYGIDLGNPRITVRNLLTHTSEGQPGSAYQYSGYRYGKLGPIIEEVSGKPFYALLMEQIVLPLKMTSTAPGISRDLAVAYSRENKAVQPYFEKAFSRLAKPYEVNEKGLIVSSAYLNEFGAFGGLETTATDLLKYADAIDQNRFVNAATQRQIFTANRTNLGAITPYGLGWFVQRYQNIDFYWHYGQTQGESALFIKVPQLELALAVLCNSDKLSQPFPLGDGDLFTSPVGQWFYRCLISTKTGPAFHNRELIAGATMALFNGDTTKALRLYATYARLNFRQRQSLPAGHIIAEIKDAGVNTELSRPFTLRQPTRVQVYGVGENCSTDGSVWCDYGWIESTGGKIVWQMQGQPAGAAGGAAKNLLVEQVISLDPGNYVLHYKSDSAHAFNNWDSLPPDHFFWGIVLSKAEK